MQGFYGLQCTVELQCTIVCYLINCFLQPYLLTAPSSPSRPVAWLLSALCGAGHSRNAVSMSRSFSACVPFMALKQLIFSHGTEVKIHEKDAVDSYFIQKCCEWGVSEELGSSLVSDLLNIPDSLQEPCEVSIQQPFAFHSPLSPAAFGLHSNVLHLAELAVVNKVNAL